MWLGSWQQLGFHFHAPSVGKWLFQTNKPVDRVCEHSTHILKCIWQVCVFSCYYQNQINKISVTANMFLGVQQLFRRKKGKHLRFCLRMKHNLLYLKCTCKTNVIVTDLPWLSIFLLYILGHFLNPFGMVRSWHTGILEYHFNHTMRHHVID